MSLEVISIIMFVKGNMVMCFVCNRFVAVRQYGGETGLYKTNSRVDGIKKCKQCFK